MKSPFVLALLTAAATTALAQKPGNQIHGPVLSAHVPTPPQMPISRLKTQNLRQIRPPGRVTLLPSYLYLPYTTLMPQETSVSVNVNNYTQSSGPLLLPSDAFAGSGYQLWTPSSDGRADDARPASDPPAPRTRRIAEPSDVNSLDAVVRALYDLVSGPSFKGRDWDRYRTLFVDDAHMIATVTVAGMPARVQVMTTDEYINNAAPLLQRGVFQKEVSRTVEQFGRMAQVFSTYESRYRATDEKPYQRGVNSIQLLNDGTRWWILSVYWDAERPDNPIPPKYLTPRQQ